MDRSQIPSLDDLRALEAISRCGSVRGAAEDLSLTHGAVSRRVSKLAEGLHLALLRRDGRGVRLTPAGEKLAQATTHSFELLRQALTEAREPERSSAIVLSCERSVAMRWLIPRLSTFQDAHREIAVHLSVGGGPLDFARRGVSMAIRRLDFALDPGLEVTVLMPEMVGPVLVPALNRPFDDGDYIALGSLTRRRAWQNWLKDHPNVPKPREIRYFDHHFLVLEAASAGLGVALAPQVLAIDEVQSGKLSAPLGFDPDGSNYGLIWPRSARDDVHACILRSWIRSICATLPTSRVPPGR